MRQEDYLLREISKIGDFILALMGKLEEKRPIQAIKNEFLDFTGISLEEILQTPAAKLPDLLSYQKGFNNVNMERLADLFSEMPEKNAKLKGLQLYQISSEMDRSFSMNREAKIALLKQSLNDF